MRYYRYHRAVLDLDQFAPHLTPVEMLERGVFGGGYFHRASPEDMEGLGAALPLAQRDRRAPLYERNCYGVKAGMSYVQWLDRGWIRPEDPLGWFHWYCRYHAGRRHDSDDWQMARWINYGQRWRRMADAMLLVSGVHSPAVLQGFLQWGYEPLRALHEPIVDAAPVGR